MLQKQCVYSNNMLFCNWSGSQEVGGLKSPGRGRSQRVVIDGLSEKSSVVTEPWERMLEMVCVVGSLCDWQGEKGSR